MEVYVDSMKIDDSGTVKWYNIGTFKRYGKSAFPLPENTLLTPARSKAIQIISIKNQHLYQELVKRGIVNDLSYKHHLSPKPFNPVLLDELPDSEEHRVLLKHLESFFPRSIEDQRELAKKSEIPLVAHLHHVAFLTQVPDDVEGDEPSFA